ncbi:MAG: hypothetical protein M3Q23_16760 [Actinomycetota bacterium]|nr:hypothetical protein [Actinomycetota bacterium]
MRRAIAIGIGLVLGAAVGVAVLAVAGHGAAGGQTEPPAFYDPSVPRIPEDSGTGEQLLLVVGGGFATQQEAESADAQLSFGDIQGYYVVPASAYLGLSASLPSGASYVLASAFRTRAGAEEFAALAGSAGAPARIVGPVTSLGGPYAGLGQEADPSGQGPLLHALSPEEQAALQ